MYIVYKKDRQSLDVNYVNKKKIHSVVISWCGSGITSVAFSSSGGEVADLAVWSGSVSTAV